MPGLCVDMHNWISDPDGDTGACGVCLAGAVIATKTQYLSEDWTLLSGISGSLVNHKMYALDYFRQGLISEGLHELEHRIWAIDVDGVVVPDYDEDDPEPFFTAMNKVVAISQWMGS